MLIIIVLATIIYKVYLVLEIAVTVAMNNPFGS